MTLKKMSVAANDIVLNNLVMRGKTFKNYSISALLYSAELTVLTYTAVQNAQLDFGRLIWSLLTEAFLSTCSLSFFLLLFLKKFSPLW